MMKFICATAKMLHCVRGRDNWKMNRSDIPKNSAQQCATCKNHIPYTITCKAFPNGIPIEIAKGNWDHRETYPGDNGILYDPVNPDKPMVALHPKNKVK